MKYLFGWIFDMWRNLLFAADEALNVVFDDEEDQW